MTSATNTSQQYTFDYEAREKAFIDYARSKGYKEVSEFDLYNFECKAIRSLNFNIWEWRSCRGRASTPKDIIKRIKIVGHHSYGNQLPELIEEPLKSLEGKVLELGEFALKMFDFENQDLYFKVHCFSDLPQSEKKSHELICGYALRKTGQRGDVRVYCEEESACPS